MTALILRLLVSCLGLIVVTCLCQAAALEADDCPAKDEILKLLAETPGYQVPDVEPLCRQLESKSADVRKEALAGLARSMNALDNLSPLFAADKLRRMKSIETAGARQALRTLQYIAFFKKYGLKPEGSYFFGAAVMTIGLLNLHSSYVVKMASRKSPLRLLAGRVPRVHLSDPLTFSKLSTGNKIIFRDLAGRTALAARCHHSLFKDLDYGKALNESAGSDFPLLQDPKKCRDFMTAAATDPGLNWTAEMVECEQDIAQQTIYNLEKSAFFTLITSTPFSRTPLARPAIEVPQNQGIRFQSLVEYWAERGNAPTPAVFSNFAYRTPWLKEQLIQVGEIVRQRDRFDLERAIDDVARQASFYLAPLMEKKCDVQLTPIKIVLLSQGKAR